MMNMAGRFALQPRGQVTADETAEPLDLRGELVKQLTPKRWVHGRARPGFAVHVEQARPHGTNDSEATQKRRDRHHHLGHEYEPLKRGRLHSPIFIGCRRRRGE